MTMGRQNLSESIYDKRPVYLKLMLALIRTFIYNIHNSWVESAGKFEEKACKDVSRHRKQPGRCKRRCFKVSVI